MKWFVEKFLPSLYGKKTNCHGKCVSFLTPKQADVCYRYFKPVQSYGDYGVFSRHVFEFNGHKIELSEEGKFFKIYWNESPNE